MNFSEKITLQSGIQRHSLLELLLIKYLYKKVRLLQVSFWIPIALAKIFFFHIIINLILVYIPTTRRYRPLKNK